MTALEFSAETEVIFVVSCLHNFEQVDRSQRDVIAICYRSGFAFPEIHKHFEPADGNA